MLGWLTALFSKGRKSRKSVGRTHCENLSSSFSVLAFFLAGSLHKPHKNKTEEASTIWATLEPHLLAVNWWRQSPVEIAGIIYCMIYILMLLLESSQHEIKFTYLICRTQQVWAHIATTKYLENFKNPEKKLHNHQQSDPSP